jgi:MFS family permease
MIIALFGFIGFFGFLLGSYLINPLGDLWGRAITFRISMVIQIAANIMLLLSNELIMLYLSLFFIGFASAGRVTVGHIWFLEHLPEDK